MNRSFVLLVFASLLYATIIHVPGQYPTIQQGLNAAQSGDTVLVDIGTYPENIVWPSVDGIFLVSEHGPQTTIIDGGSMNRVITFSNFSYSHNTIISGFTIQNGAAIHGAGINTYGSPQMVGNIIQRNIARDTSGAHLEGGGIRCDGTGSPIILANLIRGNVVNNPNWNYGGGIYVDTDNSAIIWGNTIESDSAIGNHEGWCHGAGIYCAMHSHPEICHNIIHSNVTTLGYWGHGAGIFTYDDCDAYILSNLIYDNINQCDNWNYGAGMLNYNLVVAYNNTIVNNSCIGGSWRYGGGIYVRDSTNTYGNNIIVNNNAATGGGIYVNADSNTVLLNNDVWNNTGGNYYGILPGSNDISVDPMFVTGPLGDYYLSQTAAGQPQTSPCVDYGFTTAESLVLNAFTTRTDTIHDTLIVDLGYHYPTSPWFGIQEFIIPANSHASSLRLSVWPTLSKTQFSAAITNAASCKIRLAVYDGSGRFSQEIFNGIKAQGTTRYIIDVHDRMLFPTGVYFIVVECSDQARLSKKVIIAR